MKYDARACQFNMGTGCVELLLRDGRKISINCTGVEDALDVTMAQRSELDYLIYNDPLAYAELILNGEPEEYLRNAAGSHGLEEKSKKTGCALPDAPCKNPHDTICTAGSSPTGTSCFFFGCDMSLFRLPCSKFPLTFLAVPAGKDGRIECPCQTVDGFIGVRGKYLWTFFFVQTHAPLIVPPWQSRARKSKFQFLSGARARKFSTLHLRLVAH